MSLYIVRDSLRRLILNPEKLLLYCPTYFLSERSDIKMNQLAVLIHLSM